MSFVFVTVTPRYLNFSTFNTTRTQKALCLPLHIGLYYQAKNTIWININLWCYSPEEPRQTELAAARCQNIGPCGQQSTYPSTLTSVFLTTFCYFSCQIATQLSSRGWVDPVPDPILPEKFLGYSQESNPGPLGYQSDVLTAIPNRRLDKY